MCDSKMIEEIDLGKRIPIKKTLLYVFGLLISSGLIGWLFTVIFWISGTDNSISKNTESIIEIEEITTEIINQQKQHYNNHDEMIFNL